MNDNKKKTLVTYTSMYGSTAEVANFISDELNKSGIDVEIKHTSKVTNIDEYDSIIIGASIRFDRWMKEARNFVNNNEKTLSKKNVIFFYTCMTLSINTSKAKLAAEAYTSDLYNLNKNVKPIEVKGFAGSVDYKKIPFYIQWPLRVILHFKGAKEGDHRDWNEIKEWSNSLIPKLK